MKPALVVLGLSLLASSAYAQAPFPGAVNVDGGWVPCSHELAINAGKGCTVGTPAPTPTPPAGSKPPFENLPPACLPWPNPYTEQARLIQCNAALGPAFPPTKSVYRVGDHYARPYSPERIVVLSITRGVDETVVITAQWLTGSPSYVDFAYKDPPHVAGDVFAFKPGKDDQWQSTTGPATP